MFTYTYIGVLLLNLDPESNSKLHSCQHLLQLCQGYEINDIAVSFFGSSSSQSADP